MPNGIFILGPRIQMGFTMGFTMGYPWGIDGLKLLVGLKRTEWDFI